MNRYQYFVKHDGKTISFQIGENNINANVYDLKIFLFKKYGTAVDKQTCIYSGRILEDTVKIKDRVGEFGTIIVWP